jgi:hypothetical protein
MQAATRAAPCWQVSGLHSQCSACMHAGGDWGSAITSALGGLYPQHCRAIHLNMCFALPQLTNPWHVAQLLNVRLPLASYFPLFISWQEMGAPAAHFPLCGHLRGRLLAAALHAADACMPCKLCCLKGCPSISGVLPCSSSTCSGCMHVLQGCCTVRRPCAEGQCCHLQAGSRPRRSSGTRRPVGLLTFLWVSWRLLAEVGTH